MKIHYYGHSGISIEGDQTILVDPWLGHPLATIKAEDIKKADYIIPTHNHFDHVDDIPLIAKNTNATVVGIVETIKELEKKGCTKTIGCNMGGKVQLNNLHLVFTPAFHSMSSNPSGVLIFYQNKTIYHAGDTSVFSDMKLIGDMYPIDIAFLPVGAHYTMGPYEANKAIQLLNPKQVVPIHYNTFDLIKQPIDQALVQGSSSELIILKPGEELIL